MPDLKKVIPGSPLSIPASTYNAFIDAAQAEARRRQDRGRGDGGGSPYGPDVVPIKNTTAQNLGRFSVLGLDAPIIAVADAPDAFKQQVSLTGVLPATAHAGKFAILLEPIAAGAIGQGLVNGTGIVQLDVQAATDTFAEVAAGVTATLKTAASGSARILWKESGTGTKWGVVRLGNLGPPGLIPVTVSQVGGAAGGPTTTCSFTYDVYDFSGNQIATAAYPAWKRLPGKLLAGQNGTATISVSGVVALWQVDEVPDTGSCGS